MRILVGVLGGALVALMLFEIFLAFLLPRRVKRDPLLARRVAIYAFGPWRALARRLPDQIGDTLLGMYGPFGLLLDPAAPAARSWAPAAWTSARTSTSAPPAWSARAPPGSPRMTPSRASCRSATPP